jgi:hypothetical protein
MRPMFDIRKIPKDTPVEWALAINSAVVRLRARKVDSIPYDDTPQLRFCCRWITIYLQAHIRRGLSLLESGIYEIAHGRPLAGAMCARALLEDASLMWGFNRAVIPLLETRESDALDRFIFPQALASRLPGYIAYYGEEMRAKNILTSIDKMTAEHANVRPVYDELSEVCHPNSLGVLWHFADLKDGKNAVFDDGARMKDNALHHLIFCGLMFAAEDEAISKIQGVIDAILQPT